MDPIIWILISAGLVLIELITLGLTSIWFAIGAIVAAIFSYLGFGIWVQLAAFLVVTTITLIFTRPIAHKLLNSRITKTNVEEIIEKIGVVTEDIDNLNGQGVVKLDGMEWSARSVDDSIIPKDQKVKVCKVSGVKLIVKPADTN